MMIHASSKTDEIMSRYRPIAPKPELPIMENPTTPKKIQLSPPTRARKKSKAGISPRTHKRARTHLVKIPYPCQIASLSTKPQLDLSHGFPQFPIPSLGFNGTLEKPLATLSLLQYPSSVPFVARSVLESDGMNPYSQLGEKVMELNSKAGIPQERDMLQKLQLSTSSTVIAPQAVRPIYSSISVGNISECPSITPTTQVSKRQEEVEDEVESEALPAVVSDSNNRVRLANSAYNEMVGQPECPWLDSMVGGSACERISGEVMLDLADSKVPVSLNSFSCRVKIEWGSNGLKNSIIAPCDVSRLSCDTKDYLLTWRFNTREASESNSKA
ncbi:hypothetical protein HHK36_009758 [Tetracentron sinense]|uniref:DUF7950 domain-containing protein n=1 Tax=Tetracentron sinense TaxID=13715 RepID=A0A835DLL2_TETSI|nr:hypothetical protein HHK36_009758 [Tetracentron sinense]